MSEEADTAVWFACQARAYGLRHGRVAGLKEAASVLDRAIEGLESEIAAKEEVAFTRSGHLRRRLGELIRIRNVICALAYGAQHIGPAQAQESQE